MRRTAIIVGVAALAPLLVFGAMLGAASLQADRERTIQERLSIAREINAQADGELMADQAALRVLAGTQSILSQDWERARVRVGQVAREHPHWRNVIVTDARTQRILFELQDDPANTAQAPPVSRLEADGSSAFGNIAGARPLCPCVYIHQPIGRNGEARYILSLAVGTERMQRHLTSAVRSPDVGAIVDRDGAFLARTVDYESKLGQPATIYVRRAIASAESGVYQGVTYEGLRNHSAFVRSSVSGFSTHIAIPETGLNTLSAGSTGLALLAMSLALLTAATGVYYVMREQSRWRDHELRRVRAQKLEAIGHLASSVAHDFNNLLSIILASTRRLERQLDDPDHLTLLAHVRDAGDKGAALIKQLLSFTRDKPLDVERVKLGETIAAISGLLQQTLGPSVQMSVEVADGACALTNRAQLESALLNLCVNACDAMADGGSLMIRAKPSTRQGHVELSVTDTGIGMPAHVAERALDPFFTTKGASGSGLGLAQVQNLVLQSNGAVEIASAQGAGTTVRLILPSCPGEGAPSS